MSSAEINDHFIKFIQFDLAHLNQLVSYLNNLSDQSKKRFGPHPFSPDEIIRLFEDKENYRLYIAKETKYKSIIAYTIIKTGWVDFDIPRLEKYGLEPSSSDCTIAPSVADQWQSRGLGSSFLNFIIHDITSNHRKKRIILWGGVQSDNLKAISLYQKLNFKVLGEFEHNGTNFDMMLET